MTQPAPIFISRSDLGKAITVPDAVRELENFLLDGFDPEHDGLRTRLATNKGQLLQMPSTSSKYTGTKILTVSPGNASARLPVIQGLYTLFGGSDQRPLAVIDGTALTNLRTPAVSALGALRLSWPGPKSLLVFGTGPQAWEHIKAFHSVFALTSIGVVGRNAAASGALAERASAMGLNADVSSVDKVADADLVICCTGSSEPLFDGSRVKDKAVVVAIGSHEPEKRELDDALLSRAGIYVESLRSSLNEAGDIIQALASGAIAGPESLNTLADVVSGRVHAQEDRPAVFKTTGMPWEDLALAAAAYEACSPTISEPALTWNVRP